MLLILLHYSSLSILFFQVILAFLGSFRANLLVIFLESSKILTSLRELALFHTLANIPVDKGALGVHEVELVVNAGKSFGNG